MTILHYREEFMTRFSFFGRSLSLAPLLVVLYLAAACGGEPDELNANQGGADVGVNQDDPDVGGEPDTGEPDTGDDDLDIVDGVSATEGDHLDRVVVSWEPLEGVTGYRILRDGADLAEVEAGVTSYDDEGATQSTVEAPPQAVTATEGDRPDAVALSWDEAEPGEATTHDYQVIPLFASGDGEASAVAVGYLQALAVERYEIQRDDEQEWIDVGSDLSYDDDQAPAGSFELGTAEASQGEFMDRVVAELVDYQEIPGDEVTYVVRAVYGSGEAAAEEVTGFRGAPTASIQWQRSAGDSDEEYSDLLDATEFTAEDTDAPADGEGRYYRVRYLDDEGQEQFTDGARGFRGAIPEVVTLTPDPDDDGRLRGELLFLGVPELVNHGFCWGPDDQLLDLDEQGETTCIELEESQELGEFSAVSFGANSNTPYYYRAFASSAAGTAYGEVESFEIFWDGLRGFTTCGSAGREGPDQGACNAFYSSELLEGEVEVHDGIQHWVVPVSGVYRLEAHGAMGGGNEFGPAGWGARMAGDFELYAGQVIFVAVGQEGGTGGQGGGGGGGSFVVTFDDDADEDIPLLIAGGGGGYHTFNDDPDFGAPIMPQGGHAEEEAERNPYTGFGHTGGSGGGFEEDGLWGDWNAEGGRSWENGLTGGRQNTGGLPNWSDGDGGFGSGGGGSWAPGSGGGYIRMYSSNSDGNGRTPGGNGGTSFNGGFNQDNESAVKQGHGRVTIDFP